MSSFDVRFVPIAVAAGERDAGLEGNGTLIAVREGLSVRGQSRRTRMAGGLAIVIAIVAMVTVLSVLVLGADSLGFHIPTKLAVVAGLATLVGAGVGSMALLERVLPLRQIETTIPWPYVASARADGIRVQVVTTSADLGGTWAIETERASELLAEMDRARSSSR